MATTRRREDGEMEHACPNCGRWVNVDDGFYDWPEPDADHIACYCNEPCQISHHRKNGWTDSDFNRDAR